MSEEKEQEAAPIAAFPMWAKVTMFLGFPTVACVAMSWGIWTMILWGRDHVAEPVVKSHLEFMTASQEHMNNAKTAMQSMAGDMKEIKEQQGRTAEYLRQIVGNKSNFEANETSPGPGGLR